MKIAKKIKEKAYEGSEVSFIIKEISSHVAKKNKGRGEELRCNKTIVAYAQAFIYEPANSEEGPLTYVHDHPSQLYSYVRELIAKDSLCKIVEESDGPPIASCIYLGIHGEKHNFLEKDGHVICSLCKGTICLHCPTFSVGGGEICLACKSETLVNQTQLGLRT